MSIGEKRVLMGEDFELSIVRHGGRLFRELVLDNIIWRCLGNTYYGGAMVYIGASIDRWSISTRKGFAARSLSSSPKYCVVWN